MCFQYAIGYEFGEEQKEDLWYYVQLMDAEFLQWWIKKQPKAKTPKARHGRKS